jgi:calcium-dependent protein kinase
MRVIKSLKKTSLQVEDSQIRFGEVDLLRQLDHPNIVKIFDLYQDHKNYYIITEYTV